MTNVLIVEDNPSLRKLLSVHLRRAGYQVLEAVNGQEALDITERTNVRLIISDVQMPLLDGYGLLHELRQAGNNTPVLLLTVRNSLEDKRTGFHAGADDYLTKPVDFEELLLRVEALLRRYGLQQEKELRLGECVLHANTLLVTRGTDSVELRPREFSLLEKLLSSPNRIFTRQMLMDDLWGYESESEQRTVDTHIRRLREKLANIPDFEIQTVRGLGYRAVTK